MAEKTKAQRNKAKQERRALERRQREARKNRRNTIAKIRKRLAQIISGGALIFGIYAGGLSLLPKIGISAASSLNPNNPFATPFIIKNDGLLWIKNIQYFCGLYQLKYVDGSIAERHAQGDVRFTHPSLASPKIKANVSATVFCDFGELGSHGPITSGDIAIIVSYRPAFVFWQREQRQRFSTLKSADGVLSWHPKPD